MAAKRPVRLPPPDFAKTDLPVTTFGAGKLWRLHEKGQKAIFFSLNPGHRFSHASCPCKVLYLGESLTTCIWERFGDDILNPGAPVSRSLWVSRCISRVQVPDLKLCDLTDETTSSHAKVDLSALTSTNLEVPQEWSLKLQEHPLQFDGLRYLSRFNRKPCIALFERAGLASRLVETCVGDLVDSAEAEEFLTEHRIALV